MVQHPDRASELEPQNSTNRRCVLDVTDVGLSFKRGRSLFRSNRFELLKQVSFSLYSGETLGIVGRNGSGKSTLLRVLAGIFRPDAGQVSRHCRSVSLLSLAVGFDGELNGYDNVILTGTLLGHSRRSVMDRLPDIVEFSELHHFMDQPVKTYSSGMKARLGFSIATTLEAEVLLIDEVLSVGDFSFRRKAEERMTAKLSDGQSVVLVSHAMPQIQRLCDRVLWLEKGEIVALGEAGEVVEKYLAFLDQGNQLLV